MKLSYKLLFVIIILTLGSCKNQLDKRDEIENENIFQFPKLNVSSENGQLIDTSKQMESTNYVSKNTSTNKATIHFSDLKYFDQNFRLIPDSLPFSLTNDIQLFVDDSQHFTVKFHDNTIPYPSEIDAFDKTIPKHKPLFDSVEVYPVFIVNYTDSIQGIENHDGKIIMIQEALNSKNEWLPIEYFSYSGCGNSYGVYILEPNCYLMSGVYKYQGNFKTKLRIRLITNDRTILSNEYSGNINQGQFIQEKSDGIFHSYLKQSN